MTKFIKNITYFLLLGLIVGEIIVRTFTLTSDIPRRVIDDSGIQKYIPNQSGNWKGGGHKWQINNRGWPGELPDTYDNLVGIIGDSYIENFMNPNECHQSKYLKKMLPTLNFIEASRSGVSFIEAMEISKQLDTLDPKMQLIHVHDSDFYESIVQIKRLNDITQIDLDEKRIIYGKMKAPGLKLILYNWKFIYYLYLRFSKNLGNEQEIKGTVLPSENKTRKEFKLIYYKKLLEYVNANYRINNKLLIFRPESDKEMVDLAKKIGFRTIHLSRSHGDNWSFDHDSHWTCYGHEKAALQVAGYLKLLYN